jgi:hypothetical protein
VTGLTAWEDYNQSKLVSVTAWEDYNQSKLVSVTAWCILSKILSRADLRERAREEKCLLCSSGSVLQIRMKVWGKVAEFQKTKLLRLYSC